MDSNQARHRAEKRCRRGVGSRSTAAIAWWGVLLTSIGGMIATFSIRPEMRDNFITMPWGFVFPLLGLAGLIGAWMCLRRGQDARAFLSSGVFIIGMLGGTAFAMYPNLLTSSIDPARSLTAHKVAAQQYGLTVGLVWWVLGIILASGYFIYLYRSFRGKVSLPAEGSGY